MRELFTEIEINAPPDRVWETLVDLLRWSEWNAFIPEITGEAIVGSRLHVKVAPPGGKAMSFKATVSCVQDAREFIWVGTIPIPGAFRGEHIFELRPLDGNRTHLIHREEFSGWMLPILWGSIHNGTQEGFAQMNEQLKSRVESTQASTTEP